ncbi:hypothetical protein ACN28E_22305 [Archangium lansingense]|uniref:hypothetical protein n=1 Tax=Archangium lansingense TaxID=2995310 RepID=UPI003B7F6AF3
MRRIFPLPSRAFTTQQVPVTHPRWHRMLRGFTKTLRSERTSTSWERGMGSGPDPSTNW